MKNPVRCTPLLLALAFAATLTASAQMGNLDMPAKQTDASAKPLASPAAQTDVTLGATTITIHYNSPAMRGRVIMGGLVPYGQVWRTGANPATSFVTTGNLKIGSLTVPAGNYTLYTLPAAPGTPWLLIINKQTGQWGTVYKQDMDLGRTPLHSEKLSTPQESMTITFEHTQKRSTDLHIKWDTTDQSVKIEAVK
jgi:Protein of unknown function (DUF2911)